MSIPIRREEEEEESTVRIQRPSLDVILSKLSLNNSARLPLQSRVPTVKNCSTKLTLKYYKSDFIYRVLYYPEQMMYIAQYAHLWKIAQKKSINPMVSKEEREENKEKKLRYLSETVDPLLSKEENNMQLLLFTDCERIMNKEMEVPKLYEKYNVLEDTNKLAKKLRQTLQSAQNTFEFRYVILRIILTSNSIREHVRPYIPKIKYETLIYLLECMFVTERSSGVEGVLLFEENKFNKITSLILSFQTKYMMNFGKLLIDRN
ncbi:MAG: hypothetical protein ACTSUE_15830 [Promethearchaeota archaeon]